MNTAFGQRTWWYLFQHPITDEVFPVEQRFIFNHRSGEWELPSDQPSLPNLAEGSDFYETRDEAMGVLRQGEWRNQERGDDDEDTD